MKTRSILLAILPFLWTAGAQIIPISGPAVPQLAAYDRFMTGFMTRYGIPAAQLAITHNGKLIFAHGYGVLDSGSQAPVQPDSLFRIASLTKPLTAVAILQLVDQGLVDLDKPAFGYLPDLLPLPSARKDSRIAKITVRNLLQHSGGWDINSSQDPLDIPVSIANAVGKTPPASTVDTIRYMLGQPLDFDPGARFAYANLGYMILGRIVEQVTGMNYEQYVRTKLLAPLGIERMRVGNTLPVGRIAGETSYVGQGSTASVFPFGLPTVPWPYGGWYLEEMDSCAGWVGSGPEVLKFWNAIDGRRGDPLLSAAALAQMTARPSIPDWANTNDWYGMGIHVVPSSNGAYWWHDGELDGIRTLAVRAYNGFNWVVLFDKFSYDAPDFGSAADSGLWTTFAQINTWPDTDLYSQFVTPATNRPAIQTQDGVLNGASFLRGFTAGSWISIFGVNLSNTTRIWAGADFRGRSLPTTLDGVTVKVGGLPAAIYYISPSQLNVQVPAGLSPGAVTVEVLRDGLGSGPALGELRLAAPALFTRSAGGALFAAAVFPDGVVVGNRLARPGDRLWLYGSNFEAAPAGSLIDSAQQLSSLPVVRVGGVAATVEYAGLVGAGLYQVNIVVPNVPDGDQTIELTYAGAAAPKNVFLTVKR